MKRPSVFWTLLKVRIRASFDSFSGANRGGKVKKKDKVLLFAILMIYVYGVFTMMFAGYFGQLAGPQRIAQRQGQRRAEVVYHIQVQVVQEIGTARLAIVIPDQRRTITQSNVGAFHVQIHQRLDFLHHAEAALRGAVQFRQVIRLVDVVIIAQAQAVVHVEGRVRRSRQDRCGQRKHQTGNKQLWNVFHTCFPLCGDCFV